MSNSDDILLELTYIGNMIKVIAIDENTALEVSFGVPRHTSADAIKQLAKQKLLYVKNKKANDS